MNILQLFEKDKLKKSYYKKCGSLVINCIANNSLSRKKNVKFSEIINFPQMRIRRFILYHILSNYLQTVAVSALHAAFCDCICHALASAINGLARKLLPS